MLKNVILLLLFPFIAFSQNIPFPENPSWESNPNNYYSTGLGIADIDGDGWKDLVVANGNDMAQQHLTVYYNLGDGAFNPNPDWESADIDYHGHLSIGDINDDGWLDVAVSVYIGPAGFSEAGYVKVYYNLEGELESVPSFISEPVYNFSCALGDADGDGDLDLATTAGEPYNGIYDQAKIFYNDQGLFNGQPDWESDIEFGSLDVEFGDVDSNGYLDVIYTSEETPNYIFLADDSGWIDPEYDWKSEEIQNYINSVDFGFVGSEKIPGIVMTGNDQLGGDGKVRLYDFENGVPTQSMASWTSNPIDYGSGIVLYDLDIDGVQDLIYGGWWEQIFVARGLDSGFELIPSYSANTASVVEAILLSDLDQDDYQERTDFFGDVIGSVVYPEATVEEILEVKVDDILLQENEFCWVLNKNWISSPAFNGASQVEIKYKTSRKGDLIVTNWGPSEGNYIFYNDTLISGITQTKWSGLEVCVVGNPVINELDLTIDLLRKSTLYFSLKTLSAVQVYHSQSILSKGRNEFTLDVSHLPSGFYVLEITGEMGKRSFKISKL